MNEVQKKCLGELQRRLAAELGHVITTAWVAGSAASDDSIEGWSDIDIRVVLSRQDYETYSTLGRIVSELSSEFAIELGAHTLSTREYLNGGFTAFGLLRLRPELDAEEPKIYIIDSDLVPSLRRTESVLTAFVNISYIRSRNQRFMIDGLELVDWEKGGKILRSCVTIVRLALICVGSRASRKADVLRNGEIYFSEFDFDPLRHVLEVRSAWTGISPEHWDGTVREAAMFVENFTSYFYELADAMPTIMAPDLKGWLTIDFSAM